LVFCYRGGLFLSANTNEQWQVKAKEILINLTDMKTIRFSAIILFVLVIMISAYNQSYIVLQHGSNVSQFTILDSAIVHAQNRDYIYLPGGNFTLNANINKKLYIYGAGHYPGSTSVNNLTKILNNLTIVSGADSGLITGVSFTGNITFGTSTSNQVIHTFSLIRCILSGNISLSSPFVSMATGSSVY